MYIVIKQRLPYTLPLPSSSLSSTQLPWLPSILPPPQLRYSSARRCSVPRSTPSAGPPASPFLPPTALSAVSAPALPLSRRLRPSRERRELEAKLPPTGAALEPVPPPLHPSARSPPLLCAFRLSPRSAARAAAARAPRTRHAPAAPEGGRERVRRREGG